MLSSSRSLPKHNHSSVSVAVKFDSLLCGIFEPSWRTGGHFIISELLKGHLVWRADGLWHGSVTGIYLANLWCRPTMTSAKVPVAVFFLAEPPAEGQQKWSRDNLALRNYKLLKCFQIIVIKHFINMDLVTEQLDLVWANYKWYMYI